MSLKQRLNYYGRFKDMPWFDLISKSTIMVFGQGGIGSHLTFFLARTGAEIITVDFDTVEEHNIAGQLYGKEDVKKLKVTAMVDVIGRLCGECNITPVNEEIDETRGEWVSYLEQADVVCVSFDSIYARRLAYNRWKKEGKQGSLFVDGRMSIENGQVFTVLKDSASDYEFYETSFFDDSEVEGATCTMKATTHCGSLIASLMVAQITNWFNNLDGTAMPREVVKQLNFNLPLMMFEEIKPKSNVTEPIPTE